MDAPINPPIKNSGLAIWSLVLGILGLVFLVLCIGPLFAIPAVICGHIAYGRVKRSGGALTGDGFALAGLITGYITIALGVVMIPFLAAIAIPNFVKARDTAQRNVCINNLRRIETAKQQWALERGKSGDDTPTAQDIDQYIPGGFASLHCPRDGEYTIGKVSEVATCSIPGHVLGYQTPSLRPRLQSFSPRISRLAPTNRLLIENDTNINNLHLRENFQRARCLSNLRAIDSAKRIWAMQNNKQTGAYPIATDIAPYLPAHQMPVCPGGGSYYIGPIGDAPTCNITGHQLPGAP